MVEDRFPTSGLSSEYGDIIIGDVTGSIAVEISFQNNVVFSEVYTPDLASKVYIKEVGSVAMMLQSSDDFMDVNGYTGRGCIVVDIKITASDSVINKTVSIYPSVVNFSGSLDVGLLKDIPLSRTTNKITAKGRTEFVSFYGDCTLKAYVVKRGLIQDESMILSVATYIATDKIYNTNVSPSVIASLANCSESDLIYYNIYKSIDSIIRFTMDERNYPSQKTFVFRNCFGAQETFTCVGDEKSDRKWTRVFGSISTKRITLSRDLENKITVSSGYISAEDIEVLEDLLNSDQVCLLDQHGFQDIVIIEENFSDLDRDDELKEVSFSYRFSHDNQYKTVYKAFNKPRIFADQFDQSFN